MPFLVVIMVVWILRQCGLNSWWNPKTWWDDSVKLGAKVVDEIKHWCLTIINNAIGLVENDINDTIGYATSIWDDAYGWVQQAISTADNLYNRIYGIASGWVNAAIHDAQSLFNTVYSDARSWVNSAISDAENLYNKIYSEASGWVQDAIHGAEGLYNKIYSEASGWVKEAENLATQYFHDLEKWATDAISAAYNAVYGAIKHDFIDPINVVLGVIEKAWDWVAWFAEHPFALLHDIENDVIDWTAHLPQEVESLLQSQSAADGFDTIGQIFGG